MASGISVGADVAFNRHYSQSSDVTALRIREQCSASIRSAGDIPPNGVQRTSLPIVVLLKRIALCTFCKFLEALNVGLD